MDRKTRIACLISGNGSNLQALIDAQQTLLNDCTIVRVISNRKAAFGITRANLASIPTTYHNLVEYKKRYPDSIDKARSEYDQDLAIKILEDQPNIVVCAGWHILAPTFLDLLTEAKVPVINLHPALPGAYNGAQAIERAHKDWLESEGQIEKMGVMIHFVISEVDMGEPILVKEIPFVKGLDEDIDKLKERVHEEEHEAIVAGTRLAISRLNKESNKFINQET